MHFYKYPLVLLSIAIFTVGSCFPLEAQETNKPNLFLDCNRCNSNYLKENVTIVNYVRDKADAQIHLLVTRAQTGSGGIEYTLSFIGKKEFEGSDNKLIYVSQEADTQQDIRSGLAKRIKAGLIPYVSQTPLIEHVGITLEGNEDDSPKKQQKKWNHWIFEVGANTDLSGEEQQSSLSLRGDLSADRITKNLKVELQAAGRLQREKFTLGGDDTTFTQNRKHLSGLVVKSLSPHWSVGGAAAFFSSTFNNIESKVRAGPAIEYNIFPYQEYNVHELSFLYRVAPTYNSYRDTTIYNKTEEFLMRQSLTVNYEVTKPWGSVNTSLTGSNFLHDFNKNRLNFHGKLKFRLFRGLSLNISGNVGLINDQIAISAQGITDEEALLRLRDRATSFRYQMGVGISYTFGSIYNNIVNPRF